MPSILIVDDEPGVRSALGGVLRDEGYDVDAVDTGEACLERLGRQPYDVVVLDIWMPGMDGLATLARMRERQIDAQVVIISGHGNIESAVRAIKLGAFDFVEKPLSIAKLLRTAERALEAGKRRRQAHRTMIPPLVAPVGKSRLMLKLREQVQQVATHDASVMLVGEPGTGREAFARYMHTLGPRAAGPFVALTCASLDDTNAADRLRGSVAGGKAEPGLFEQTRGGTLYLGGVEDLTPNAQRLLLADLGQHGWQRQGSTEVIPFEIRFITGALPGHDGPASGLRRDLLAYLEVISIRIPPLREYAEDVPELLRHYVDRLVDEDGMPFRHFSVAAQNRLRNYPWPGNVRELRNLVQRVLIIGGPEEIGLDEIEQHLVAQQAPDEPLVKQDLLALPLREARVQFERAYLLQQLMLCNGKVGLLAKRVGMERTHLYRKLRSLGVDFRQISED